MGIAQAEANGGTGGDALLALGGIPLGLFLLTSIIPGIAIIVRRFHDQDKSGWMYLLNFIPYIGGIIIFIFMLLEGTRGPNRFGEDPLNPISNTFN